MGPVPLGNKLALFCICILYSPAILLLGLLSCTCVSGVKNRNFHLSTFDNSKYLMATQVLINKEMDKYIMVYDEAVGMNEIRLQKQHVWILVTLWSGQKKVQEKTISSRISFTYLKK